MKMWETAFLLVAFFVGFFSNLSYGSFESNRVIQFLLLKGTIFELISFAVSKLEVRGNNRSVMPLDVLGRTRATMILSKSILKGDFELKGNFYFKIILLSLSDGIG